MIQIETSNGTVEVTHTSVKVRGGNADMDMSFNAPPDVSFEAGVGGGDGALLVNGALIRIPNDRASEVVTLLREADAPPAQAVPIPIDIMSE